MQVEYILQPKIISQLILLFCRVSTACLLALLSQFYRYWSRSSCIGLSWISVPSTHSKCKYFLQTWLSLLDTARVGYYKPLVSNVQVSFLYHFNPVLNVVEGTQWIIILRTNYFFQNYPISWCMLYTHLFKSLIFKSINVSLLFANYIMTYFLY